MKLVKDAEVNVTEANENEVKEDQVKVTIETEPKKFFTRKRVLIGLGAAAGLMLVAKLVLAVRDGAFEDPSVMIGDVADGAFVVKEAVTEAAE